MTNQHSTTGAREALALAMRQELIRQAASDDIDGSSLFVHAYGEHGRDDVIVDGNVDLLRLADAILSAPSRMAASSEGEPVAWRCEFRPPESTGLATYGYLTLKQHETAGAFKVTPLYAASPPPVAVPVSEELVEIVARALYLHQCPGGRPDKPFEGDPVWMQYEDEARAAVKALTAALALPDKGVQGDHGAIVEALTRIASSRAKYSGGTTGDGHFECVMIAQAALNAQGTET